MSIVYGKRDHVMDVLNARPAAPRQVSAPHWRDVVVAPFNFDPTAANLPASDEGLRLQAAYGIGFTGHIPPGGRLAVARGEDRAGLIQWARDTIIATTGRPWAMYNFVANVSPWSNDGMAPPPGTSILHPGDVITWDDADSLAVWAFNPYLFENAFVGLAEDSLSTLGPYVRMPRAVARVFMRPEVRSQRLNYTRVPWVIEGLFGNAPSAFTDGYPCYGTHLTISWKANATNLTRISTTESFDVWWLMADGVWHHHENDDFDAGGRGEVTATHDIEVFEIPQSAMRVAIDDTTTAGTETPMLMFEDRGP